MNIYSSCKKQKQICNTRTITSEKHFFHKIINFCIGTLRVPWRSPVGPNVRTFRGRPRDVVCRLGVSYDNLLFFFLVWAFSPPIGEHVVGIMQESPYDNLFDYKVYHPEIVANHGSFIPLMYSLTDLITQPLRENNPLFYDLWSTYHSRAYQETQIKKWIFLYFLKSVNFSNDIFTNSYLKYG